MAFAVGKRRRERNGKISPPVKCFAFDSLALSRYPILFTAWSAEQNRPLRPQMFPFSATGGGHICYPSRRKRREQAPALPCKLYFVRVGNGLDRSAKLHQNLRAGVETRPYNGAPSRRPLRTQYIFSRSGGIPRPHKITSKSAGGRTPVSYTHLPLPPILRV